MTRHCNAVAKDIAPNFDDVTLYKHIIADENAFILFKSFSYTKKYVILAINIVFAQIAISITSSPSGTGFYVKRWVIYVGW